VSGTLTAKGVATRRRIVEGAAAEIREHGVALTTLDDVRARSGTSKGQLFHYFPEGKEQLLLEVARHEAERILSDQQPYLGELASAAAWWSWRDAVVEHYRRQGQTCPLAALTSHLGRSSPAAQMVVTELVREQQSALVAGIRALQRCGQTPMVLDADHFAAALVAGIQGGVMILLTTGSVDHLEAVLDVALCHLGVERPSAATECHRPCERAGMI
jgi:AcrR family transcriptional regulator